MAGGFRSTVWDPTLIISQIVTMQCIFYVGLGVSIFLGDALTGHYSSVDQIFSYTEVHFSKSSGACTIIMAYAINVVIMSYALWYVVQRSKQCMDFVCTAHLFHLTFCWAFSSHFPTTLSWWLVNIMCAIFTTVGAETLCRHSEIQEIPIGPKVDL